MSTCRQNKQIQRHLVVAENYISNCETWALSNMWGSHWHSMITKWCWINMKSTEKIFPQKRDILLAWTGHLACYGIWVDWVWHQIQERKGLWLNMKSKPIRNVYTWRWIQRKQSLNTDRGVNKIVEGLFFGGTKEEGVWIFFKPWRGVKFYSYLTGKHFQ